MLRLISNTKLTSMFSLRVLAHFCLSSMLFHTYSRIIVFTWMLDVWREKADSTRNVISFCRTQLASWNILHEFYKKNPKKNNKVSPVLPLVIVSFFLLHNKFQNTLSCTYYSEKAAQSAVFDIYSTRRTELFSRLFLVNIV